MRDIAGTALRGARGAAAGAGGTGSWDTYLSDTRVTAHMRHGRARPGSLIPTDSSGKAHTAHCRLCHRSPTRDTATAASPARAPGLHRPHQLPGPYHLLCESLLVGGPFTNRSGRT